MKLKQPKQRSPKRRKRPSGEGYALSFHGSYNSQDKARRKASQRDGFVISRVPRGTNKRRYIVCAERTPF